MSRLESIIREQNTAVGPAHAQSFFSAEVVEANGLLARGQRDIASDEVMKLLADALDLASRVESKAGPPKDFSCRSNGVATVSSLKARWGMEDHAFLLDKLKPTTSEVISLAFDHLFFNQLVPWLRSRDSETDSKNRYEDLHEIGKLVTVNRFVRDHRTGEGFLVTREAVSLEPSEFSTNELLEQYKKLYAALSPDLQYAFNSLVSKQVLAGGTPLYDEFAYRAELFVEALSINDYVRTREVLSELIHLVQPRVAGDGLEKLRELKEILAGSQFNKEGQLFSDLRNSEAVAVQTALATLGVPTLDKDLLARRAARFLLESKKSDYFSYCCSAYLCHLSDPAHLPLLTLTVLSDRRSDGAPMLLSTHGRIHESPFEGYLRSLSGVTLGVGSEELQAATQGLLQPSQGKNAKFDSQAPFYRRYSEREREFQSHPLRRYGEFVGRLYLSSDDNRERQLALRMFAKLDPIFERATVALLLRVHRGSGGNAEFHTALQAVARNQMNRGGFELVEVLASGLRHEDDLARGEQQHGDASLVFSCPKPLSAKVFARISTVIKFPAADLMKAHALVELTGNCDLATFRCEQSGRHFCIEAYIRAAQDPVVVKMARALHRYGYHFHRGDEELLVALEPRSASLLQQFERMRSSGRGAGLIQNLTLPSANQLSNVPLSMRLELCTPVAFSFFGENSSKDGASYLLKAAYLHEIRREVGINPIPEITRVIVAQAVQNRLLAVREVRTLPLRSFEREFRALIKGLKPEDWSHENFRAPFWNDILTTAISTPKILRNVRSNLANPVEMQIREEFELLHKSGWLTTDPWERTREVLYLSTVEPAMLERMVRELPSVLLLGIIGRHILELSREERVRLIEQAKNFSLLKSDEVLAKRCLELKDGAERKLLVAALTAVPKLSNEEQRVVISLAQQVAGISDYRVTRRVQRACLTREFTSATQFQEYVEGVVRRELAKIFPSKLVHAMKHDEILDFASIYLTFGAGAERRVEPQKIRVVAIAELLGRTEELAANKAEYLKEIKSIATGEVGPEMAKEIASHLRERRASWRTHPGLRVMTSRQRKGWRLKTPSHHQVIAEATIEDKLVALQGTIRGIFHFGHLSKITEEAFLSSLPGAQLDALAREWRGLNQRVGALPEEDPLRQECIRRQGEIAQQQKVLSKWNGLATLRERFDARFEEMNGRLTSLRKELGVHAEEIEALGFEFAESFGPKIFRGELGVLKRAVMERCRELAVVRGAESPVKILEIIARIESEHERIEGYLGSLGKVALQAQEVLHAHQASVSLLLKGLSEAGERTLAEVGRELPPELWSAIEQRIGIDQSEEQKRSQAIAIAEGINNLEAIRDLEAVVRLINPEEREGARVYTYRAVSKFSEIARGTVGQCLDYRSGINRQYLLAYTEPHARLIVGYDQRGTPRVDGAMIVCAVAEKSSKEKRRAVVALDTIYTTDHTPLTWSKIEGHIRAALEATTQSRLKLFVPEHVVSRYFDEMNSFLQAQKVSTETVTLSLVVDDGATGELYTEIRSLEAADQDQNGAISVAGWLI